MFPATLLTAGALGLVLLVLSYRVVQMRLSGKISIGDGGNEALSLRIRAHGNFAEYVPLALLLMLLVEAASAGTPGALYIIGGLLVLARVLHAWGLALDSPNKPRIFGMVLTFSVILLLSLWAMWMGAAAAF
jgi:uncharacterized membrane protein YecN with MAPEG domain